MRRRADRDAAASEPLVRARWSAQLPRREPEAAGTRNLAWLLSARKFHQIAIAQDGFPVTMVAPDPRLSALHKLWLAEQPDREPVKKGRDRTQAKAVLPRVLKGLPVAARSPKLRVFRAIFDAAAWRGYRRGPVLYQAGNVIGVVVSKLDALKLAGRVGDLPQNVNFAIRGEFVRHFLEASRIDFAASGDSAALENTEIASRGRR